MNEIPTKDGDELFFFSLKNALSFLVLFASFSFIFYFVGFLYRISYFTAVGLKVFITPLGYEETVVLGFISLLGFLALLPPCYDLFRYFNEICALEKETQLLQKEITDLSTKDDLNEEQRSLLKQAEERNQKLQKKLEKDKNKNFFHIFSWLHFALFILLTFGILIFNDAVNFYFILAPLIFGQILIFLLLYKIKKAHIEKRFIMGLFSLLSVYLIIFFCLWPICHGFISGWITLHAKDWQIAQLTFQDDSVVDVDLIEEANDFYITRFNDGYRIIPKTNIKEITIPSVNDPWVYEAVQRTVNQIHSFFIFQYRRIFN
jgi:hypothetical protein